MGQIVLQITLQMTLVLGKASRVEDSEMDEKIETMADAISYQCEPTTPLHLKMVARHETFAVLVSRIPNRYPEHPRSCCANLTHLSPRIWTVQR